MSVRRLGAVEYLNARPLVWGLDAHRDRFSVRYDVPSRCAALLDEGAIDLGLVPSIEGLRGSGYRIVPGVGIGSAGPVASVALYSRVPIDQVRSVALDASSRTSVTLVRILCARAFGIRPSYVTMVPDPAAMLEACDAALLIGDLALLFDHAAAGLRKIDLGEAWTAWTGLPFIYACWIGRPGVLAPGDAEALRQAQAAGVEVPAEVARKHFAGDEAKIAIGTAYLRDNMRYGLAEKELAGLTRFYREAADLGLVSAFREPRFF